ncbi:hypothetical protein Poly30_25760 [Planctomycetes bacterium Poly30]|uniref:Uncharacterized protein n=1 Tax=Saltatorellus ferox TaxID=2528018 RepID=A0A518ESI7_9BACT|nr:hypothetical protein Poly30_25760 [Planctomycetes bacterium Poly30]
MKSCGSPPLSAASARTPGPVSAPQGLSGPREACPRGPCGEHACPARTPARRGRPSGEDACAASAQRCNRYFLVRGNARDTARCCSDRTARHSMPWSQSWPLEVSRHRLPAVRAKRRTRGLRLPANGLWAARGPIPQQVSRRRSPGTDCLPFARSVERVGSGFSLTACVLPAGALARMGELGGSEVSSLGPQTSDLSPQPSAATSRSAQLAHAGERSSGQHRNRQREASAHAFDASRERQAVRIGRPAPGDLPGQQSAGGLLPRQVEPGRAIVVTAKCRAALSL